MTDHHPDRRARRDLTCATIAAVVLFGGVVLALLNEEWPAVVRIVLVAAFLASSLGVVVAAVRLRIAVDTAGTS